MYSADTVCLGLAFKSRLAFTIHLFNTGDMCSSRRKNAGFPLFPMVSHDRSICVRLPHGIRFDGILILSLKTLTGDANQLVSMIVFVVRKG